MGSQKLTATEIGRVTTGIKSRQLAWAKESNCSVDEAGYCSSPEANLPWLSDQARAEFDGADGNEFGNDEVRGKIRALHSSSALAVNVFEYWRSRDVGVVGRALGSASPSVDLRFEQKFKTGVGPRSPNLDVVVALADESILAIESKFSESFGTEKKAIKDAYFEGRLWTEKGLAGAQKTAEAVRGGASFGMVDAPQLLKHMLGLANQDKPWSLTLLWYAPDSEIAEQMAADAAGFKKALGEDSWRFSALTYQDLWPRIVNLCSEADAEYVSYIQSRYFPPSVEVTASPI